MSKKPSEWTCAVCGENIFGPNNGKFYSYKVGQEHYLTLRLFGIPVKKYYADTCDYVHEWCNDDYKAQRIKKEGTLLGVFKRHNDLVRIFVRLDCSGASDFKVSNVVGG